MSYNMAKKAARTPSINRALLRRPPTRCAAMRIEHSMALFAVPLFG
jgi:hypothetical protein